MDIAHFTLVNSKPANFNSLREVILIIFWPCYLEIDWRWESVQKKVLWLLTSFRWYVWTCPLSSWTIPADIVEESWVKNCTVIFYNHSIGMRSYLVKSNFKFNLQKNHFLYVYEAIINFITCLYIPLALIRWNRPTVI